jgi:molecular chaperone GrpE
MAKAKRPADREDERTSVVAEAGAHADPADPADPATEPRVEEAYDRAPDGDSEALPAPDLEMELKEARDEAAAHLDDLLRAKAEIENLRKRSARDLENAHKFGLEGFMNELLPVKDSVELGLDAAADAEVDADKLRQGLELTLKLFDTAADKYGLEEVNPEGQGFDPEYHQAMSTQEVAGKEPGTVVTVVQKGYLLNGRLLRPAMVIVAR